MDSVSPKAEAIDAKMKRKPSPSVSVVASLSLRLSRYLAPLAFITLHFRASNSTMNPRINPDQCAQQRLLPFSAFSCETSPVSESPNLKDDEEAAAEEEDEHEPT